MVVGQADIRNPVEVVGNRNPVAEAVAGKHHTEAAVGTRILQPKQKDIRQVVDTRRPLEVAGKLNWTQLELGKP